MIKPRLTNIEIADLLFEMADLSELNGDDSYKVSAYRKAAKVCEGFTGNPLTEDMRQFTGIGKALAEKIEEAASTGMIDKLYRLRQKYPDVSDLTKIPGVGLRTAFKLHTRYKVQARVKLLPLLKKQLKKATEKEKKQLDKLIANCEFSLKAGERLPRVTVERRIKPILEAIAPYCSKLKVTGSIRRRRETVKDVDILVCTKKPKKVMKTFHEFGRIATGESDDQELSSIYYEEGRIAFRIDLVLVPEDSWGAGLCYFTGSMAHNVILRKRAKAMGMILNRKGLFKVSKSGNIGKCVASKTERDIYKALDLSYFPPEIREDRYPKMERPGVRPKLPTLIRNADIHVDLHMHTVHSDGKASVSDMVETAMDRGLSCVGISDHCRPAFGGDLAKKPQWKRYLSDVKKAKKRFKGEIDIYVGAEVDVDIKGNLVGSDEFLDQLDYVIASCHVEPNQKLTDRWLKAMEDPRVKVLGHPTGRIIGSRPAGDANWELIFKKAASRAIAIEVNGQPSRQDLPPELMRLAASLGCIFLLNSDAHSQKTLKVQRYAVSNARRAGISINDVIATPDDVRLWLDC